MLEGDFGVLISITGVFKLIITHAGSLKEENDSLGFFFCVPLCESRCTWKTDRKSREWP